MTSSSLSDGRSKSDSGSDIWLKGDITPDRALSDGLRAAAWMSENGDWMREAGKDGTGAARW